MDLTGLKWNQSGGDCRRYGDLEEGGSSREGQKRGEIHLGGRRACGDKRKR